MNVWNLSITGHTINYEVVKDLSTHCLNGATQNLLIIWNRILLSKFNSTV